MLVVFGFSKVVLSAGRDSDQLSSKVSTVLKIPPLRKQKLGRNMFPRGLGPLEAGLVADICAQHKHHAIRAIEAISH
jgi:hypothetical protein